MGRYSHALVQLPVGLIPLLFNTCTRQVNANDENAEMSGYLHLWKDRKWKKTWFVLKEKVLYAFKASEVNTDL